MQYLSDLIPLKTLNPSSLELNSILRFPLNQIHGHWKQEKKMKRMILDVKSCYIYLMIKEALCLPPSRELPEGFLYFVQVTITTAISLA